MLKDILAQGPIVTDQARAIPAPKQYPSSIHQAMRHSVFARGYAKMKILSQ
jgi:hypothetical protein